MGHEFSGAVEALGKGVSGLIPGERVMVNSLVHCGKCDLCRRGFTHLCRNRQIFGMHRLGAFSELVNVPANIVYPLPDGVSDVEGAMVEPLGNGVHVVDLAKDNSLETVLVCGAGTIGLMCMQAAQARGAKRIAVTDTNAHRLEIARDLGAELTLDPSKGDLVKAVLEWTDGTGVELSVDAVGVPDARRDCIRAARPGGDVVWIGLHQDELTISSFDIVLAERRVMGSYGATDDNIRESIRLFAEKKIRLEPWTEVFPLDQGADVFLSMLRQEKDAIKAVLAP
jgi:L-iditol 2-dehydrogenase